MSLTVELNGPGIQKILDYIKRPVNNALPFFKNLGAYFYRTTNLTFKSEGARDEHPAWSSYKKSTLQTDAGTWKIRYGTDMKGIGRGALTELKKKWGWGHIGYMRKGARRYSFNSKMLQASGSFKDSFRTMWVDKSGIVFGSNYHAENDGASAAEIAGKREILFLTMADKSFIRSYFSQFIKEAMQ